MFFPAWLCELLLSHKSVSARRTIRLATDLLFVVHHGVSEWSDLLRSGAYSLKKTPIQVSDLDLLCPPIEGNRHGLTCYVTTTPRRFKRTADRALPTFGKLLRLEQKNSQELTSSHKSASRDQPTSSILSHPYPVLNNGATVDGKCLLYANHLQRHLWLYQSEGAEK